MLLVKPPWLNVSWSLGRVISKYGIGADQRGWFGGFNHSPSSKFFYNLIEVFLYELVTHLGTNSAQYAGSGFSDPPPPPVGEKLDPPCGKCSHLVCSSVPQ